LLKPRSDHRQKPKGSLHPRSLHRELYDFKRLVAISPALLPFVKPNAYNILSVDYSDPAAVIALNQALLKYFYNISNWSIPQSYLCPPVPGRADYVHYIADVLAASNDGVIPTSPNVTVLDIGAGANLIYPLIGNAVYGWRFIASDIDPVAIKSAQKIIQANPQIAGNITCRLQPQGNDVFTGIVKPGELIDLTMCNPPFHRSAAEAAAGTVKKLQNLGDRFPSKPVLNFGGKHNELWCAGGEAGFINRLVTQSAQFAKNVFWFSTLVSKKETLNGIYKSLDYFKAADVKTISMAQGQKVSRAVAWTFLTETEQQEWKASRWHK